MRQRSRLAALCSISIILVVAGPLPVIAYEVTETTNRGAPVVVLDQGSGPTDPAELEAFLDGVMAAHLATHNIAGATFSFVKNGELFFAKGWGWADREQEKPVVADESLFSIASVSKLFTWTAVMQLYEQGRLDLNADINAYLEGFEIPDTYPEPVKLEHLLTHTPGFEDLYVKNAPDQGSIVPLRDFLPHNIPTRVRPPGVIISYSNHGTAIAGHIVELVSGMAFADYIDEHIYKPLGMGSSTFHQSPPPDLAPKVANSYSYVSGRFEKGEIEWDLTSPAGAMKTTATDMAMFMIAHLHNGMYAGNRILKEETARLMHSTLFRLDPRINGFAYGFKEFHRDGQRIIGHGGDLPNGWHSHLALLLDHDAGFFVSYNSPGGAEARDELIKAFLDRYYPGPEKSAVEPFPDFPQRAGMYSGVYRAVQHVYSNYAKLFALIFNLNVKDGGDGTLVTTLIGRDPQRWVEVKPMYFREVDGLDELVFTTDEEGSIVYAALQTSPSMGSRGFYRIPWHQQLSFNLGVLLVCLMLFFSALLAWPLGALRGRFKGDERSPRLARLSHWVVWLISGLLVVAVLCIAVAMTEVHQFGLGLPPVFAVALTLFLIAVVLTVVAVVLLVLVWRNDHWRLGDRLHYTAVVLAAVVFAWFLNQWNLVGFRL